MIVCGWCGKATERGDRCASCGHVDPTRPWEQRNEPVPVVNHHRAIAEASRTIEAGGERVTIERLAERLDVSPRTVRRWQKVAG